MRQLPVDRVPVTLAWLGTFGAVLTVAGVDYPGQTLFTLVFLLVTPVVCFAQLLPGLDPLARAVVSVAGGISLIGVVAEVMLAAGWWSPRGGVIAVGVLCAVLLAIGPGHRGVLAGRGGTGLRPRTRPAPRQPEPAIPVQARRTPRDESAAQDDDAWIYEE